MTRPDIPESAIEHVVEFSSHWVDKWTIPNPFISPLYESLRPWDVTLADFAFKQDAKNVSETTLVIFVNKLGSTILVGIDKLTFHATNPDWGMAPDLVKFFDTVLAAFQAVAAIPIKVQESTLAFHVRSGHLDLAAKTSDLVRTELVGAAEFYGISKYRDQNSLLLERSLKYRGGAFFRLTRKFDPSSRFADVALSLYADEVAALAMIGIEDLV